MHAPDIDTLYHLLRKFRREVAEGSVLKKTKYTRGEIVDVFDASIAFVKEELES